MKIVVTGGGTGGHIYPALALIKEIKEIDPASEFLYIGTKKGLESDIVPREGIPFETVEITGFKRKLSLENVKTVMRFVKGTRRAKKLIKDFKADAVIGTGGYVAGPVVFAAAKLGIPTLVHEQNSVPGLTNKFLSRYVDKVAISFKESSSFFPKEKVVFTGNPRASEAVRAAGSNPLPEMGLDPHKKVVLVVGGSRGARPINEAFLEALPEAGKQKWQFLYVTGAVHYDKVMEEVDKAGNPSNVVIKPFIHNMPAVLSNVDVIVTRAGATTLAEITALGLPSILIPSPYVTNNHQEKNARSLSDNGAAVIRLEKEMNGNMLLKDVEDILGTEATWERMNRSAKELAMPDSAKQIYNLIQSLVKPVGK
ncbi:undecaprenyldiphospho-muramoylpentapeptide beta-N-acetylglucosaminyltransferase [Thalassorhabdus alkalitolerans]|uniref:UDP-N-acetylglucosamine--N-acetylmuramyl-(pentapeptide) pyrophosphoryl-undecaprenol N-acetylglucosamine transferase n=1 Tax=Thalassorhabdus alkalitolerans TaxID=2282697 RepID=A0ABW0YIT6_9BACI